MKAKRKTRSDKGKSRPKTTQETALSTTETRETKAHSNANRPERISIGARQTKLDAMALEYLQEGWHFTWQSDIPGNLERMKRAWYEFVTDEKGQRVSYPSRANTVFLMKIEEKYFEEDQARLEKVTSDRLKAKIKLDKDEYAPDDQNPHGGVQALTKEVTDPTI